MLEHRLQQFETPESSHANGNYSDPQVVQNGSLLSVAASQSTTSPNVALLLAKGQVLLDTDRLNDALACFQEAISVDPTNSEAHLKKGVALERMNRLEPALAAYEEALRLNPKRAVANVNKARVLAALHRYDEAISVYDSALGRNPSKGETPIFTS
jgi:tetratricopeptide (TPR) repeat protein